MTLGDLIEACVLLKGGDTEFALYRWGNQDWRASIGESEERMRLGEDDPGLWCDGATAEEAVRNLHSALQKTRSAR